MQISNINVNTDPEKIERALVRARREAMKGNLTPLVSLAAAFPENGVIRGELLSIQDAKFADGYNKWIADSSEMVY